MPRKTRTRTGAKSEVITAKWKTAIDSREEYFGTITLEDEFQLTFPILHSPEDIPSGTTVLWGITDHLKRCTALTLPFGPHGTVSNLLETDETERLFNATRTIRYLLVGRKHLDNPAGDFVNQISFTPRPNEDLRKLPFGAMPAELFETAIHSSNLTVSASVTGNLLSFRIRFQSALNLNAALEEANVVCVFLSFLGHQYVYPSDFHVWAVGEDGPYQVHCRAFSSSRKREETWVGYTLLLPDEQPRYSDTLKKWFSTNEEFLQSRFLYRHSLKEPNIFSLARFLAVFQALEGIVKKSSYQLLTSDELAKAKTTLRTSLPSAPNLETFIKKLNNSESPSHILKRELPKMLAIANIFPDFDVVEFVDRIYQRRNRGSHAGRDLNYLKFDEFLILDTLLLTAIYVIVESCALGLDASSALKKLRGSFFGVELPLTTLR